MTTQPTDAYMGQFLQHQQERKFNLNTFIHGFSAPRYAFSPMAIVTQEKKFPDVSFYQKLINFPLMRSMTDTMIIRAGQNNWIDSEFVVNWTNALATGMNRGVYWFFDGRVTPQSQAEILVNLIKNDMPEMEIWIDWEHNYGGAYEGIKNVVAMMKHIEALLPTAKVGVYTGYYYFIQNSNAITNAAEYTYLKTKPLWLAWYTNDASVVKVPAPWSSLTLWQFGTPAVGYEYGCGTLNLDMNYFNGSLAEFTARYGTVTPPTGDTMLYGRINTGTLNVRNGGGASYTDIGDVILNDYVVATESIGGWWHLKEAYRGSWTGAPVALANGTLINNAPSAWCSSAYIVAVPAPPAPPPPPVVTKPVSVTVTLEGYKPLTLSGEMEPE